MHDSCVSVSVCVLADAIPRSALTSYAVHCDLRSYRLTLLSPPHVINTVIAFGFI